MRELDEMEIETIVGGTCVRILYESFNEDDPEDGPCLPPPPTADPYRGIF